MVKRQILPDLNILFYVLLLSFTPLNYRLCLFSFSLFLLAHIYSPYTPSVHFSLTNKWTMQQWRMQKPLTKYPKQQIFRLSLLLQPNILFVLPLLVKFTKALLCDYSEHSHIGKERGKYRVESKALTVPHVNYKNDSKCAFPNKKYH